MRTTITAASYSWNRRNPMQSDCLRCVTILCYKNGTLNFSETSNFLHTPIVFINRTLPVVGYRHHWKMFIIIPVRKRLKLRRMYICMICCTMTNKHCWRPPIAESKELQIFFILTFKILCVWVVVFFPSVPIISENLLNGRIQTNKQTKKETSTVQTIGFITPQSFNFDGHGLETMQTGRVPLSSHLDRFGPDDFWFYILTAIILRSVPCQQILEPCRRAKQSIVVANCENAVVFGHCQCRLCARSSRG